METVMKAEEPPKVRYLKLSSGDEVITKGKFVGKGDDIFLVAMNPLAFETIMRDETGQQILVLVRWVPFVKDQNNIRIAGKHIVFCEPVTDEMIVYYVSSLARIVEKSDKDMQSSMQESNDKMADPKNSPENTEKFKENLRLSQLALVSNTVN